MIHTKSRYTNSISNGYIAAQLLSEFKRQSIAEYNLSHHSFHISDSSCMANSRAIYHLKSEFNSNPLPVYFARGDISINFKHNNKKRN